MRLLYLAALVGLALTSGTASAQITANSGFWSDPTTWSTGAVPTATDDVIIADSTVTIDIADAQARNITLTGNALLRTNRGFETNTSVGLTVNGNLTITGPGASVLPLSNQDENGIGFGEINHRLTVKGNIDNSTGGTFDMRRGATSTNPASAAFIDLIFSGDQTSTLTLGDYDNNTNQLFRVEIAKENGAVVSLGSNATQDNSSAALLTLTSGYLVTNEFKYTLISNNSSNIIGGSPASYVRGELARGFPTGAPSSQYSKDYPIGDATAYRPVTLFATQRVPARQQMGARVVAADADNGSSALQGGLTDVSPTRYYAFTWYFESSNQDITIERVEPTYGTDDGVPEGSNAFVVASSVDGRATWTNAGAFNTDGTTAHTTTLASPPTAVQSGNLTGWVFTFTFDGTNFLSTTHYAAIGTTAAFVAGEAAPTAQSAALTSAPNPTAGATALRFSLDAATDVSVGVYDVLGRRVATVTDGPLGAGDHDFTWDARGVAPGVYVVRLQMGNTTATRMVTVAR